MDPLKILDTPGIVVALEEFIRDYGSLSHPLYALVIALWTLATHCYQKFDAFGYLNFTSVTPGSGKTRMLEILECICRTPKLRAKVTLAGICSLIEQYDPTILFDQAERLSQAEHNDLMACLLSGYRQGLLVTIQRNSEAIDRPIYGPKAFALLGDMIETVRDRSIVIPMQRMPTRKRWYRPEAKQRGERLMNGCTALMQDRTDDIDDAIANFAGLPFLLEREEEIWTPLFVMCEVFCAERRKELEQAAADNCAAKRAEPKAVSARRGKATADAQRDGERLVRELLELCGSEEGIRTSEALRGLKEIYSAPWRNYAGEGLTDMKLAELVRAYGVAPRQFKREGKNLRGYLRADLRRAVAEITAQPATLLPRQSDSVETQSTEEISRSPAAPLASSEL